MFGFRMYPEGPGTFKVNYKCYSVSMCPGSDRQDVEKGGKIIMPPSALDTLTRLNIQYPMLFKLTNQRSSRHTHCGVLEFVADEGRIYIPYWMMRNLFLDEGDLIQLESVSLPVATFAKFQPQSVEFLDITNAKAVLENALRSFACLSRGDMVAIKYNEKMYELNVLETKPGDAVSIIECDMNVDFAPPIGYKEPERQPVQKPQDETDSEMLDVEYEDDSFRAFSGSGNRLDGKKKGTNIERPKVAAHGMKRGIPNYNYKVGKLTFIRAQKPKISNETEDSIDKFEAFSGGGQAIRKKNSRK